MNDLDYLQSLSDLAMTNRMALERSYFENMTADKMVKVSDASLPTLISPKIEEFAERAALDIYKAASAGLLHVYLTDLLISSFGDDVDAGLIKAIKYKFEQKGFRFIYTADGDSLSTLKITSVLIEWGDILS